MRGAVSDAVVVALCPLSYVAETDSTAIVWDVASSAQLCQMKGHTDWLKGVSILPDGNVVTCSDDKSVRVWNTGALCC